MLRRGYEPGFAAGTIAAAGHAQVAHPALAADDPVLRGREGVHLRPVRRRRHPRLITIAFNLAAIAVAVRLDPQAAPAAPRVPRAERLRALRAAGPTLVLMLTIFGGLYSGTFTVNEAASVAVVMSLVFALLRRRLTRASFIRALLDTAGTASCST